MQLIDTSITWHHNYLGSSLGQWVKVWDLVASRAILTSRGSQHPHEVGPTITYPLLVWKHERSESNKTTSFMGML